MFSAEDIQARLRQKPFRPFRFIVSEGLNYEVVHPDLVFVGRHDLQIGFADPITPTIYNGLVRVALVHIVAMQEMPVTSVPQNGAGNGPTA